MATCNVKFLGELFNLSVRRIEQLAAEGHVIRTGRGQYNLLSSVRGYIQYLKELAKASEHGLTEENRKIKELKRMEIEGKLINADDLKLEFAKLFTDVKERLRGIPTRLAGEIYNLVLNAKNEREGQTVVFTKLTQEIDEALKELSQWKSKKEVVCKQKE